MSSGTKKQEHTTGATARRVLHRVIPGLLQSALFRQSIPPAESCNCEQARCDKLFKLLLIIPDLSCRSELQIAWRVKDGKSADVALAMFPESLISFPAWSGEAAQVFVVSLARTRTEAERRQASHALRSRRINFQRNEIPPQSQATAADFCFPGRRFNAR